MSIDVVGLGEMSAGVAWVAGCRDVAGQASVK